VSSYKIASDQSEQAGDKNDIVNIVIGDKLDTFRSVLVDIFSQIDDRKHLKKYVLRNIDMEICEHGSELHSLQNWYIGISQNIDTRRNALEKLVCQLEKEKRDRVTESWRDISELKRELRQRFIEYCDVRRKFSIIRNIDTK